MDDLALEYSGRDKKAVELVLSQDLVTLAAYLHIWFLELYWS